MPERHDITVRGCITDPAGNVVTCPNCGAHEDLTIHGPNGGTGALMCPVGHHFPVPEPIDAVDLLARAAADPRTVFIA
ncbi:hypothetical protein ACIBKZ_18055 [Streptomyces sp. NPDC050421]|uniref:hypothetical protein n=1 Tax=Streptomyces sp. NPDC050421 TaxID=3365613 RepID=UPI0037A21C04